MNLVDIVIIVLALAAALHGLRVGALAQLAALLGFLAGLALGVVLVITVDSRVHQDVTKTVVAVALLVIPAALCSGIARQFGARLGSVVRHVGLGVVDAAIGAAVALVGTVVVCWLFASVLINSSSPTLSRAIEGSAIIRRVDAVMPPVPEAFAKVQSYLSTSGFPEVLANVLPESLAPVRLPDSSQFDGTSRMGEPATVKVIAFGCGDEQEGSGFVTTDGLVVTNAHVIAGTREISVQSENGTTEQAIPVLFDKNFDLAVLKVPNLSTRHLQLDPNYLERGNTAVVLGYPGGGPFNAQPAGIASRFVALGRDIYNGALTSRVVYQLRAEVRPGNSGGPLIGTNGEVIGVVFSRSSSNPDIGYALASPGVATRVRDALGRTGVVSTQACIS